MELSPSNSIFNQSGIYQLHPTRQGEALGLYRFSRGANNSTLLGAMIYALRTHYLPQQPWKAKNHYLGVAGTRPPVQQASPAQGSRPRSGARSP